MVTAGTYGKVHFFLTPERRDSLLERLQLCTVEYGWELQSWAVLANHYHFFSEKGMAASDTPSRVPK
jgi:hypothetical protein